MDRRTRERGPASTEDADNGAMRGYTTQSTASRPDPTALTTQQLLRENFWLRELLETRIDGMDKALQLLQAFADRTPTTNDVQHEVDALREVVFQRLEGIRTQIAERDTTTEKASKDVKSAVDAAFAAAKEAVSEQNKSNALSISKSEAGVTKQIDSIIELIRTTAKGVDDKISDIKERITIIESKTSISDPSTAITLAKLDATVARLSSATDVTGGRSAGMTALWGLIVGGLGLLFGLGAFIVVLTKFMK